MTSPRDLQRRLLTFTADADHSYRAILCAVLASETGISSAGFPFISEAAFQTFIHNVPHLFADGLQLVEWLAKIDVKLKQNHSALTSDDRTSVGHAVTVVRNIVYSAGVCAPPDLWLLRQVLSSHAARGTLSHLLSGAAIAVEAYASEHKMSPRQLELDLSLLHVRGYLIRQRELYLLAPTSQARDVISMTLADDTAWQEDLVALFAKVIQGTATAEDKDTTTRLLSYETQENPGIDWCAGRGEIETGSRVVPIVLALRSLDKTKELHDGVAMTFLPTAMQTVLRNAAFLDTAGRVTDLGARVFERGPGPFGIIHAYHPYMRQHQKLLDGHVGHSWVARGENVAASQDANRKTFELANKSLDRFASRFRHTYGVFIEHAVGQGEASRQRFTTDGEDTIRYFGADLEDAAIDKAIDNQKRGVLPRNMMFVRHADIGKPALLIDAVRQAGLATDGAVMMVGNGFHEVRAQTNDKMIAVFKAYHDAGIIIIFTEESALEDEDLLATAWNTYHAGFRYVHELSGQGLRPALDKGNDPDRRYSWERCAVMAGYKVLDDFTTRTRTIYPYPRKDGYNPAISINYFCVPTPLAQKLNV